MKLVRFVSSMLLILFGLGVAPASADTGDAQEWFASSAANVVRSHAGEDLPDLTSDQLTKLAVGVGSAQQQGKGCNAAFFAIVKNKQTAHQGIGTYAADAFKRGQGPGQRFCPPAAKAA